MEKQPIDYKEEILAENNACMCDPGRSTDKLIKLMREAFRLCSPQMQDYYKTVLEAKMLRNIRMAHKFMDGATKAHETINHIESGIEIEKLAEVPNGFEAYFLMKGSAIKAIRKHNKKAGSAPKSDALSQLIEKFVRHAPQISEIELLSKLNNHKGIEPIQDIDDGEIYYTAHNNKTKIAPISGLKHRLSRAKGKIKKESESR